MYNVYFRFPGVEPHKSKVSTEIAVPVALNVPPMLPPSDERDAAIFAQITAEARELSEAEIGALRK